MIADLKPYPRMRDSGVPWLGQVPEHWEVRRLKYVLGERDTRSPTGTEQLLRVSQYTGVTQRKRADGGTEPDTRAESLIGYKKVEPNDLVVNIMLAWNGSMGVSQYPGIASPAYCVYRFRPGAGPWYFHHLLRSPTYKARIKAVSTGVVESRLRLYSDDLYRLEAVLPPLPEQGAIVRFLDYVDRRITRYIRAKQKMIKLLEEQKQAIIHRAVTRGLDPNVRLKPSGVEWLADIPEHWEVARLKEVTTPIMQGWSPQCDAQPAGEDEWGVLKVGCVNKGVLDESQNKRLPSGMRPHSDLEISDGDILMSRANTRSLLGLAALAIKPRPKLILCDKLVRFRARTSRADDRFLVLAIRQRTSRLQIESSTNGASDSMQNIGQAVVRNLWLSLPSLDEQRLIVNAVKDQLADLHAATSHSSREVSLLREYRTRLIADVVTGKLDVREAAARLPDDGDEPEPLEEVEAMAEGSEEDPAEPDAEIEEAEPRRSD